MKQIYLLIILAALSLIFIIYLIYESKIGSSINKQEDKLKLLATNISEKTNEYDNLMNLIMSANKEITESMSKISDLHEKVVEREKIDTEINQKQEFLNVGLKNLEKSKRAEINLRMQTLQQQANDEVNLHKIECDKIINDALVQINDYNAQLNDLKIKVNSILNDIELAQKEKEQKLFYTVQVPEEYKSDISFLITEVSGKVKHPDIINKLIWSEYIKPYLDDALKRLNINEESGIYKLTSLNTGKSYIGKSTNLKTRITNHFKSAIGIKSIADQEIHHQMAIEGIWNYTIEKLCECSREQLNEKEKYYIDFFQSEKYGYNKNKGG